MYNLNELTFIIGAGAHVPYGFPTGERFLDDIKMMHPEFLQSYLSNDQKVKERHEMLNSFFEEEIVKLIVDSGLVYSSLSAKPTRSIHDEVRSYCLDFIKDLGESGVSSIDTFLSMYINKKRDKNYELIGKALIYGLIFLYERDNPISFTKHNWIHLIIKRYLNTREEVEHFFSNPPGIITFNYDNFFERVLFGNLTKYHGYSEQESLNFLKKLNIIHVYGSCDSVYTKNCKEIEKFKTAISKLLVIGEERRSSMDLESIQKAILKSKSIYFLGYGFHYLNNKILFDFPEWQNSDNKGILYSTNIGLSSYEQSKITEDIGCSIGFSFIDNVYEIDSFTIINEGLKKIVRGK